MRASLAAILAVAFGFGLGPVPTLAQGITGRIVGTITEVTGAVIPGATVVALNVETNARREVITNERGDFVIANLPIGAYEVSAEIAGFKRAVRAPVPLAVDQTARVNIALELGAITETVQVTGAAPLVNSETSSLGQVIEAQQIRELPLNGRNFVQLGLLVPGTTEGPPAADTVRSRQGGVSITANGQRENQNNWMLDGIDNNAAFFGLAVIVPSTEAIEQFKVETSNYSAEFGRAAGAVVNLQIRSGTNRFHGSLYEFLRNDAFDAKGFFDAEKPPLRFNQFGASVGGPIARDHAFFFFNYEGKRERRGQTVGTNVPTLAMRNGDFSGLPTIFDPATYNPATNTRQPFPGNQIPADRINPIARRILAAYPAPNSSDPAQNFNRQVTNVDDGDQVHVRGDYRLDDRHTFMGRYSHYDTDNEEPGALPTTGSFQTNRHRGGVLQYTWIPSGRVINEFRVGGNRYNFGFFHETSGDDVASSLGLPFIAGDPRLAGFPGVGLSGMGALGGNTAIPLERIEDTIQVANSLTWIRGDHALKFGGDARWYHGTNFQPQRARGQYSFTGVFTGEVGRAYRNGVGDLLLGLPALQQLLNPEGLTPNEPQNTRWTLYVQDDWKVSSNLTLNLGLRYERDGAWTEANNRFGVFDPATGEVVYARDYDIPFTIPFPHRFHDDNIMQDATNGWSPRLGVAWRPFGTPDTVVRGAYGIFWSQTTGQDFINTSLQVPPGLIVDEQRSGSVVPTNQLGVFSIGGDPSTMIPTVPSFIVIPFRQHENPYVQQWNVGVERQLGAQMAMSVSYVGNVARQLQRRYELNAALPPAPGPIQSRRPYPSFGRISLVDSGGESNYNALQVRAERRFSDGLSFLGAYTWSKAIDTHGGEAESRGGGIQDPSNFEASRGLSGFDLRHRFSFSFTYELPFGPGRRFLSDANLLLSTLVGGWHTSGVVTMRSGYPFSPVVSGDTANADAGTVRPDLVGENHGNLPSDEQTIDRWFDTSAFVRPAPFTFGTAGRNILIGPGLATVDLSVAREFLIRGTHRLQFRGEFFNLLNRANFGLPNSTVGTTAYGTIRSTATGAREIQFALKYLF